jgi:hypothetical protein
MVICICTCVGFTLLQFTNSSLSLSLSMPCSVMANNFDRVLLKSRVNVSFNV